MKNITNILSYLWLLLLMAVTACSDLEEEVGPMHVEEEVELNIQLHVPDMQASTREEMVITENISSIVAIAFDESDALIKKVDAILPNQNHETHSGTLKIKMPKRTRTIHFLGNYTKESIASITNLETLNNFTTTDATTKPTMRYWGKAEYNGGNNLSVTLYRNMAKLTLTKGKNLNGSCYISGFVNRNLSGTIVPSGHAVGDTPTLPNDVSTYTHTADNSLGNVYYLFEHANTKDNPLYIILEILDKYYKVAFASGDTYFPIIRNHEYTITIDGIDAMYAENDHKDAVNSPYPINDLVIDGVSMTVTASPTEVLNQSGQTSKVTVTIPKDIGITELNVPTHDAFTIAPPNGLTAQNGKYTVTPGNSYEFTLTVNEDVTAGNKTISFTGRGKYLKATGSANITLVDEEEPEKEIVTIVANPSATTLNYAANSVEDLLVNVTIPKKVTGLTFSSEDFTIKVVGNELQPTEGVYPITHDENAIETTIPVRIRLNDGVDKETASFTFDGTSNDANVEVQEDTKEITLTAADDANVRWQGNVPLNGNVYATIVPLMYDWFLDGNNFIPVGSKLNLEFTVTGGNGSTLQVFEICGDTEDDWNNPVHQFAELNNSNRYTANGNNTLSLTLSAYTFETILGNFRNDFLGETGDENKIALAIRGAGITLTKVSVVPAEELPTSNILVTAPDATEGVSKASVDISYSNSSAIEEYTITVTVPDGVTQLEYTNNGFSNVYIDTDNWYTAAQSPITISDSKSIPLRLRVDKNNNNPTITFSTDGVEIESATFTVNRTSVSNDSNVLWEGALLFQGYDVHVSKIDIPNSFLQGKLLDGAVLTLEYEVVDDSNDFISLYGSGVSNWANLENMADAGEYTDNNTSTITMTLNSTIIENIGSSSINMQGYGRVLKKVALTPPADVQFNVLEETVSLDLATNEVVLNVQKPANVTQLTITDNDNLFGSVSTTFANANVNGKTISNLPNDAATIPVKLGITRVVDIKNYTITVAGNDGSSDNVTVELLTTWSGSHSLGYWEGYWRTARKLPVGTTVQITFADYDNCSFELHTYSATDNGNDIRFEAYSVDNDEYIPSSNLINGVFSFTVATDGSVQIRNNGNFNNVTDSGLDGLQINGGDGLSVTQVNVTLGSGGTTTPTGFTYTFEDGVKFGEWNNNITTDIVYDATLESNVLKMVVSENDNNFGQIGISNGDYSGSYTLSIKYRAESSTGNMNLVFQDEDNNYAERGKRVEGNINDGDNDNDVLSTSWKTITWNLTLSGHAVQFVIQFEQVDANATFYIDDLKLVKNN